MPNVANFLSTGKTASIYNNLIASIVCPHAFIKDAFFQI